jgi:pimeloyl-ACP methyl ester carboxylesterase
MKQATAVISDSLTIAYRTAGDPSNPCILLIHGYPQTSYMYRKVIDPLAEAGYYILAPDYRGAGDSSIPEEGYDKFTMARDLRELYAGLGVKKVVVVGIDIGSMVATALALQYRDEVIALFASGKSILAEGGFAADRRGRVSAARDVGIRDCDDGRRMEVRTGLPFFLPQWYASLGPPDARPDCPDGCSATAPNHWAEKLTEGKERFYIKSFYDRLVHPSSLLHISASLNFLLPGKRPGFHVDRGLGHVRKGVHPSRRHDRRVRGVPSLLKRRGRRQTEH